MTGTMYRGRFRGSLVLLRLGESCCFISVYCVRLASVQQGLHCLVSPDHSTLTSSLLFSFFLLSAVSLSLGRTGLFSQGGDGGKEEGESRGRGRGKGEGEMGLLLLVSWVEVLDG